MKTNKNIRAYTISELMLATAASVVLLLMVYNFYATTRGVYSTGISAQSLQDGSNLILNKITQGQTEPGGVFRLQEAVSYTIVSLAELHWVGTDSIERSYKLNNASNRLIYHHPTSGGVQDEIIYAAPTGSTITLRFWVPTVANYAASVVGIDAALVQTVSGKSVNGSSSTLVTLRNHPV